MFVSDRQSVDFWFDPVCPWAWITSRWVVEVQRMRHYTVGWRFISLKMINAARPDDEYTTPHRAAHLAGLYTHRVCDQVRLHHGNEAVGALYTALGTAFHLVGGFNGSTSVNSHFQLHGCSLGALSSATVIPLVVDGKVFVPTCNGVDWTHTNIPAPDSPSFIMLNAEDGTLLGEQDHIASSRVLHCSWSSPNSLDVNGKKQIIFAAGDGWVYSMAPETEKKDDFDILKEFWRYDANPPEYRKNSSGEPIKYVEYDGPSEIIATPTVADGLIYVPIGQDPEHGEGLGCLSCIDPKGSGPD